jgi:ureidoglycolate lyase
MREIAINPLTKAAFASFGDVVEWDAGERIGINQGFAARVNGLARVDVAAGGGTINVSLFTAKQRPAPVEIALMERHPLGSQMFFPLQDEPWLVLVCADPRDPGSYRAFAATGQQGVNYVRNTWHHPLLVTTAQARFLVVDRAGAGDNLEEVWLPSGERLSLRP